MSQSVKNKLSVTTPSDLEIVLTRTFDAPRELVFEVWTTPEHIAKWWGCGYGSETSVEIDLRVGGEYRYVLTMPDGMVVPFKGEFKEIVRPERLVHTEIFDVEPYNQHPALVTVEFTEVDGKTLMKETVLHDSKESRDGHLQSGMEGGAASSYDRLEELAMEINSR